jgi:uncharacterized membrane protein
MNAYGPLFNVFALPALLNPLLPKLLFAAAYLVYAIWLIKDACAGSDTQIGSWPARVCWFFVPYSWIEIARFGHFDVLVGLLCAAAIAARIRNRDLLSGTALGCGVLLKFMPVVLLPFLILDRWRPRLRLLAAAVATISLGLGVSFLIWGPSTFRPLLFAARRSTHHLSIYRFLNGRYSPLKWLDPHPGVDQAAPVILSLALFWAWYTARKQAMNPARAAVLAILVTLLFYQVGFAQYHMVLLVLASYWMFHAYDGDCPPVWRWIPLGLYFGWLSAFDITMTITEIDAWGMQEWIGLPTFLFGCLLAASIIGFPRFRK